MNDTVQLAISIGHDADTVAAIACALLGARYDVSGLRYESRQSVHCSPGMIGHDPIQLAPITASAERRLAAYVSTMFGPDDKDNLKFYVPRFLADEPDPWVIDLQATSGGEIVRIDYGWDEVYTTTTDPSDALHQMRTVLEGGRFRIPHPQLLTVSAEGPAVTGLGVLGLAARRDVPDVDGTSHPALFTSTPEQVLGALLAHVRSEYDEEAQLDEDDDIPLVINGVRLWVGAIPSKPGIMLFTRIVDDVRSRRQACVDINGLNRNTMWSRWVLRDHAIWKHLAIPSRVFQPELFDEMLGQFLSDYLSTRLDLTDRLGGQSASG